MTTQITVNLVPPQKCFNVAENRWNIRFCVFVSSRMVCANTGRTTMTTRLTVNLVPPQKCFNDVAICRKGTYQLDDRNEGPFVVISVGMTIDNRGLTDDCKHVRK